MPFTSRALAPRLGFAVALALAVPLHVWAQSTPRPQIDLCNADDPGECIEGIELLAPLSYDVATGLIHASTVGGNLVCEGAPVSSGIRMRIDGRDYALAPFPVDPANPTGPAALLNIDPGSLPGDPVLLRAEIRPPTSGALDCRFTSQTLQLLRAQGSDWSAQTHLGANAQMLFGAQSQLVSRGVPLDPLLCAQQGLPSGQVRWQPRDPDGRIMDMLGLVAAGPTPPVRFGQSPVPATIDVQVTAAARCVGFRQGANGDLPPGLSLVIAPLTAPVQTLADRSSAPSRPAPRPGPLVPGGFFGYELIVQNVGSQPQRLELVEYFPAAQIANPNLHADCLREASLPQSQCGVLSFEQAGQGPAAAPTSAARVVDVVVAQGETLRYRFNREVRADAAAGSPVVAGMAVFVADQPSAPTRFQHARALFLERIVGGL